MTTEQFTKIIVKKDFLTDEGNTLKAGLEVEFEDLDGDLVIVSYNHWRGFDAPIAALPAEYLEEIIYGVIERRPFVKPQ
jgi:hypothetical protein